MSDGIDNAGAFVDRGNPYVGPRAFEEDERRFFFGRDQEMRQLAALVIAQRAVVLYAPSGAGKTSVLRAGVVPLLKEQKRIGVLPVARVSGNLLPGAATVTNIYAYNLLVTVLDDGADPAMLATRALVDGLAPLLEPAPDEMRVRPRLLIVDQFEELFTTHPERYPERSDFFRQLQECLQRYPQLSLLLSMREDYIAHLDFFAAQMPDRLRTRFRMERLGADAALDAIRQPADNAGIPFAPGVAEGLVDDLRRVQQRQVEPASALPEGSGLAPAVLGLFVEPVHLQIICHQLWEQLPPGRTQIVADDVQRFGDVDDALADFYAGAIARATAGGLIGERQLRRWVDAHLITPARTRGLVYRDEQSGETEGLPNAVASILNDAYIIRAEMRGGDTWYELAHDRLVEPILAANQAWLAHHPNPVAPAYESFVAAGRDSARLLKGSLLAEAQAYAAANASELSADENAFVAESARVANQERRRQRNLLIGVIAALAIMAGLTAWALWNSQRADAQASVARSRELAALSVEQLGLDPQESLLLALEAINEQSTQEGENALRRAVQTSRVERYLSGHTELVQDVAFFPDGSRLVSGGDDGTTRFWNAQGTELFSVTMPGGSVTAVDVSPDGTRVAATQAGGAVVLDAQRGAILFQLGGEHRHEGTVHDVVYSPDGQWIATAGADGEVKLWDGATGTFVRSLGQRQGVEIWSVAFVPPDPDAPETVWIAAAGADGNIRIWDVLTAREIFSLPAHSGTADSVAFSPDGSHMATAGWDNTIILWDAFAWQPLFRLPGHSGWVRNVAFSSDGSRLVSTSWDRTAKVWDVAGGRELFTLLGHRGWVRGAAFSPDGYSIATTGQDGNVLLWNAATNTELALVDAHGGGVSAVAYNPEGTQVATAGVDGSVAVWDAAMNIEIARFPGSLPVNDIAFSPGGRFLLAGGDDRAAVLRDLSGQSADLVFSGHESAVYAVAFRPDGAQIATGSADNRMRVWDIAAPETPRLELDDCGSFVFDIAYNADGSRIAAACGNGSVQIWDAESGSLLHTLAGHRLEAYGVAFAPDGSLLVSVGKDGTAIVWDASTGAMIRQQESHVDRVRAVAFSPDGRSFATASWDMSAKQWDTASGALLRTLTGQTNRLTSVAFAPDGKRLATAASDGSVLFHVLDEQELIAMAQASVVRPLSADECKLVPAGVGCTSPP